MFVPCLPVAPFTPYIDHVGRNLKAELPIGENYVAGLNFTLSVMLVDSCYCDDVGDNAAEIIFVIHAYDSGDPDEEPLTFYSGRETMEFFPDRRFRAEVAALVGVIGSYLVSTRMPERLIFVSKSAPLPSAAFTKYQNLAFRIVALGYDSATYELPDRRQVWDLHRIVGVKPAV